MGRVVLLTGATGFLGTQVGLRLLERDDLTLVALVEASTDEEARRRARRAWYGHHRLTDAIGTRVEVVAGDVTDASLGLRPDAAAALVRRLTHVVHAAANVRFDTPIDELRRTNVDGTANVLELCRAAHADHGLARVLHVSTAYVAGRRTGEIGEDDLTDRFGFENGYEQTKFEAERLMRAAMATLPITVVRPAMIVGDSRTGEITTFNTFYVLLRRYLTRRTRVVPVSPRLRVNVVPVDYVADAIARLLDDPRAEGATVHLTTPRASLPTAAELIRATRRWAAAELGIRLSRPLLLPLPPGRWLRRTGGRLDVLLPYLHERRTFRRDRADGLLGPFELRWETYFPALLRFAVDRGFLHRSGRTVHEEAMRRLRSRQLPVRYVDIAGGRSSPRAAADVRADVLAAAAALRGLGIGPRSRVAIVGPNGTRYLTLELALGLLGAVSVPLYATTPADEIDAILRASRAEALIVGSQRILETRGPVAASLPTASFCRAAPPVGVLGWSELVARRDAPEIAQAPVDLDDLATLRYTSGTTGFPKGVAFTHGQLRWMAETIASLVPWRARTGPVAYVSFLPMNHVVEGIMGTYGPYAMPASVEIAFVEDLHDVPDALRVVRPTVFFSVPRLYEKVWERVQGSPIGRRYLAMREGPAKRALGRLVRRSVLRRAGLDRCAQLLVGSAPVPAGLLERFHGLGVEVHDAYGLTEAPLLTMNRSGRNRIGTVGEPLPGTTVRIADDGEVLARGPQVTIGYADEDAAQPFRDGWLATGDLGRMVDGFLVIEGRKKELLKTSYGKYLNPAKIEARLRGIPGVTNAMVVGEARPFCAALLWVEGTPDEAVRATAADAIAEIGRTLSHPEQVKRWAVLEDDLSIEHGDLTSNLKLRRERVAVRFAGVIEELYEREEVRA